MPSRYANARIWMLLLLLLAAACSSAPASAPPVSTPAVVASATAVPEPQEQSILAAMASYERIIRDGETDGIAALTDSAPVRRFLTSAAAAAPPSEGALHRSYRITATSEPLPGLIEAELTRDDGRLVRFLFRQRGEAWLLSEASEAELGERVVITHGLLRIESFAGYTHTEAVVAAIDEAYKRVQAFFGEMPEQELRVVLKPAFGVGAVIPFDVQAFYEPGRRPQITVTVPWSVTFRPYEADTGWQATVEQLVAHELTHFVHGTNPTLVSVNKVPAWVAEGLAEYVSAPLRLELARPIQAQNAWLPLESATESALLNLDNVEPKARTVAYLQAQLLVAYLARDGQQQLWDFVDHYAAAPGTGATRLSTALEASLSTDLQSFLSAWSAWVDAQLAASPSQ